MRKAICFLGVLVSACAMQARLYDLDNGGVLQATYTNSGMGQGAIKIAHPTDGECNGEYRTVPRGSWGAIYYSGGGSAQGLGLSLSNPGAAVVTCPTGRVIECEYVTSGGGTGYCRDNKGSRYRLMF